MGQKPPSYEPPLHHYCTTRLRFLHSFPTYGLLAYYILCILYSK